MNIWIMMMLVNFSKIKKYIKLCTKKPEYKLQLNLEMLWFVESCFHAYINREDIKNNLDKIPKHIEKAVNGHSAFSSWLKEILAGDSLDSNNFANALNTMQLDFYLITNSSVIITTLNNFLNTLLDKTDTEEEKLKEETNSGNYHNLEIRHTYINELKKQSSQAQSILVKMFCHLGQELIPIPLSGNQVKLLINLGYYGKILTSQHDQINQIVLSTEFSNSVFEIYTSLSSMDTIREIVQQGGQLISEINDIFNQELEQSVQSEEEKMRVTLAKIEYATLKDSVHRKLGIIN